MAWGTWGKKAAPVQPSAAVAGLDLSATCARAAFAIPGQAPRTIHWTETTDELPLAILLSKKPPQVGKVATAKRRAAPHEVCLGFLPHLGGPRSWGSGKAKVNAATAFAHFADAIRPPLAGVSAIGVTIPAYLDGAQAAMVTKALTAAQLPKNSTVCLPLALAALALGPRKGTVLLVDVDDHALVWSVLSCEGKGIQHLGSTSQTNLGLRVWVEKLMAMVSDRCVHLCRRDPRDSASTEQSLDDQLTALISQSRSGKPYPVSLRTETWFQNLVLAPEEIDRTVGGMARAAADAQRLAIDRFPELPPPQWLWATAAAARLPGLLESCSRWLPQRATIEEFSPTAGAEAAHLSAVARARGELPAGHLDTVWPREPEATPSGGKLKNRG